MVATVTDGEEFNLETKDKEMSPEGMASKWQREISASTKELEKFHTDSKKIVRAYLDRRDMYQEGDSRLNIFWSTIETLKASLYARPPKADVMRSNFDPNDDVARVASNMLETILNNGLSADGSDFDSAVRHGIEDWLVIGMGQVWHRYEVETENQEIPAVTDPMTGMELAPSQQFEVISREEVETDYIYWEDFFYSPARVWEEVRWVARRVFLTKEKAKERFGDVISSQLSYAKTLKNGNSEKPKFEAQTKAEVFEIWCHDTKKVYWYARGVDVILDVKDDPLGIDGFFPCPKPAMMNTTTSNFVPRPLYVFAQDQFEELNEINTRIKSLTRACKVVGVYDRNADGVKNMFTNALELTLTPVDNWAMFAEKGGLRGVVDYAPIETFANTLSQLRMMSADKTQQIYEILGISDIMRGATKANETATAQTIKAQFGSTRLQYYQTELARWVREALRIKAEIIAQKFDPETIMKMSNIMYTTDAQLAEPAVELIKTMGIEQYRVNVDADTMASIDWQARREENTEILNAMSNFFAQVAPVAQNIQGSMPFLLQILQAMMAGVKGGKVIEGIMDQAIASYNQQQQVPTPPTPMMVAQLAEQQAMVLERLAKAEKYASESKNNNIEGVMQMAQGLGQTNPPPPQPPSPPQSPMPPQMVQPMPPQGMPSPNTILQVPTGAMQNGVVQLPLNSPLRGRV